jgi:hypothetical protein
MQAPAEQPSRPAGGPGLPKPNKKLITIIVGAVLGVSVLGWVGNLVVGKVVGFGMKKAIEAGTGVKVDEKGGVVSFKGKDGAEIRYDVNGDSGTVTVTDEKGQTSKVESASGEAAKTLPSSFPSDFPVMPGMKLDSTTSWSSPDQGVAYGIVWSTSDKTDKITQYYRAELEKSGWTKVVEYAADNQAVLSYKKDVNVEKGTADTATVGVEELSDVTNVSLQLLIVPR